jgi:flagellar biosynthesis/type III secretory pathway M-ring protein FliF/YscJ
MRLNANQISDIRRFMTGAIAGLKAENVIISDSSGSFDRNDRVTLTKAYECEWTAKILDALSYIPDVVVTANVILDRQSQSNASQNDSPSIAEEYARGGANTPQSIGRWPRDRLSPETTQTDTADCTPARISVSVAVPDCYFVSVWQERKTSANVTLEKVRTEETARIRSQVANLLPGMGLSDPAELVSVSTLHDLPSEGAAEASDYQAVVAWAGEHPVVLGFAAATLLGLLISWSVIQVKRATRKADKGPSILTRETDRDEKTTDADGQELSLHDELSRLIRNNPAAAADTLHAWIRNAG